MTPLRFLPTLFVGVALHSALPASAQVPEIRSGEMVSASLDATDRQLEDGSYYRLYLFRGTPGEEVVVTMRSDAFDTYVSAGRMEDTTFIAENGDDDGGGGTDSRLRVAVGPSGMLVIQANSYDAGATGAFTLVVEPVPTLTMVRRIIVAGETVTARLYPSDPVLDDGAHFHVYVYRGTPGQQITVTMRSTEIDAYLFGGSIEDGEFVIQTTDDDGAGETDALITATVGADGEYAIRASTFGGSSAGEYTIRVEVQGSR